MSAKAMKEIEADVDEQGLLILQITSLIYKINQAEIADASIIYTNSGASILLLRKYVEVPHIMEHFSLSATQNFDFTKRLLINRMSKAKTELQNIFDEGMKPSGGAA